MRWPGFWSAAWFVLSAVAMKTNVLVAIVLTVLSGIAAVPVSADEAATPDKRFGVGMMLGEPTGASFKGWLSDVSAIDGLLGVSLAEDEDFTVQAGYLYHFNDLVRLDENRLTFYVGGGPRYVARDHKDDLFGIRTVGGVSYMFDKAPLDIFFEVGPVFDLTPHVEVRYTVGIGVRYRF